MILTVKKINHNYEIGKRMIITVKLKKNDYNHEIREKLISLKRGDIELCDYVFEFLLLSFI